MRHILSAVLLLCLMPVASVSARSPIPKKIYSVVYRVEADGSGRIAKLEVLRVNDPSGPGTLEEKARRLVHIDLPKTYLAAARAFLEEVERERITRERGRKVYYTFTLYDPEQPDVANIGVGIDR